jgi:hypothetical protein
MEMEQLDSTMNSDTSPKRLAILTNDDPVWLLPTWRTSLSLISKQYEVVGIWLFPETLGKRKGWAVPLWYLKTFGLYSTLVLFLYSVLTRMRLMLSAHGSWEALANEFHVEIKRASSPNDPEVAEWIRSRHIDISVVTVSHILKRSVLDASRLGTINKHAAMLPECRGVFPYIWAISHGFELGVSFHEVTNEIDGGRLLLQRKYSDINSGVPSPRSMLHFYIDVYRAYPDLLLVALRKLIDQDFLMAPPGKVDSYFSFPTRNDYRRFRRKGGRVASLSDIFYRGKP